jgi:hypothetical protein
MPLAQSDREQVGFKPEATYGVVSGTGNNYALRLNAEQLEYTIKTEKSQELRPTRGVGDLIVVDAEAGGQIPTEFSYGEYDSLIAAAMCTAPSNVVGTNGAATGTATFSSTGIQFSAGAPFAAVESGQYIRVTGAVNTGNNGIFGPATGILGTGTGVGFGTGTFTAETGTANVVVYGARFKNGTTKISHSIERLNNDLTGARYECFRGMVVDKWSLDWKPGARVMQSFDFAGKDALPMSTGSALPGSPNGEPPNPIVNSVNNIGTIRENGAALSGTYCKGLTMSVSNNVELLKALENLGPVDFRIGEFNVQLQMTLYLADATYYNKFINNTNTNFSWRVTDSLGNPYMFTLPSMDYSAGRRPNPGRNNAIVLDLTGEGLEDSLGRVLIIDRLGAAVTPWA